MSFVLPELPYNKSDFGDIISKETFDYHYSKHHQTYVNNLNQLIKGTEWENKSLEYIVVKYIINYLAARTPRYSIMQLSIGIIPSIGIASVPTNLNLRDSWKNRSSRNGAVLVPFWLISQLRLLLISDLAGHGWLKVKENWVFWTQLMLEIPWQETSSLFWRSMYGNMPTTLITVTWEQPIATTSTP